ncbi:MAG: SDR family NAD(P)-dependent oxidoreductase [Gemmatimonadetes bacterium]|nr:MAG: short chain dehydrogenase [Gemmatimonadota bacterium]TLY54453.1 MAG: SDR family NAD(P)-dependent oxidoreductase [Gemmatimonadota bacterium]
MELPGSLAVITGATEGIGRATAFALGRAGARVAMCARTAANVDATVRALRAEGIDAIGMPCDVSDPECVTAFADFVGRERGTPRIVVNNAGIGRFKPLSDLSLEDWDRTMSVNVRSLYLVTRAFLEGMLGEGTGTIVNIASLAGKNGVEGGTAYCASKHAVLGFSKSLMLEVRKRGLRVVAICPGSVATTFAEKGERVRHNRDRILTADDVAHAVLATVTADDRAMISEVDIRPTNP